MSISRGRAALLLRQDQHPVGKVDRLLQIVGDHDHGDVLLAPDAGEFLLHGDLGHRVERAERLVEQQDLRLHGQRAGDADALRHAARKLPRIGIGEIVEPDQRDVVRAPAPRRLARVSPRTSSPKATLPSTVSQGSRRGSWKITARSVPTPLHRPRRRSRPRRRRHSPAPPAPAAASSCRSRWRRR